MAAKKLKVQEIDEVGGTFLLGGWLVQKGGWFVLGLNQTPQKKEKRVIFWMDD